MCINLLKPGKHSFIYIGDVLRVNAMEGNSDKANAINKRLIVGENLDLSLVLSLAGKTICMLKKAE